MFIPRFFKQSSFRSLVLIALCAAILFAAVPNVSFAADRWCDFGWPLSGAICSFLNAVALGIPYLYGYVGGLVLFLINQLVNVAFDLNISILRGNQSGIDVLYQGFGVALKIANLGFLLAMILIAFATIFRWEAYNVRAKLKDLVIGAVLVNFSLLIVGLILDFSHVLTGFFISGGAGDGIVSTFNPQRFLIDPFGKGFTASLNPFVDAGWYQLVFTAYALMVFTWIMAVVMLAIAVAFVYRYVVLTFLIIVMPLIWIVRILPKYSENWGKWWDKFWTMAFFLPIAAFFIYLATASADKITQFADQAAGIANPTNPAFGPGTTAAATSIGNSFISKMAAPMVQLTVLVGLLVGGLLMAGKGGGFAASMAGKLGGGIKGFAAKKGIQLRDKTLRGRIPFTGGKSMESMARGRAGWVGSKFAPGSKIKIPFTSREIPSGKIAGVTGKILRGATLGVAPKTEAMAGALGKAGQLDRSAEAKRYQEENLGKLTKEQFAAFAKSPPSDPVGRAAYLAEAVKRKEIGSLTDDIDKNTAFTDDQKRAEKAERLRTYAEAAKTTAAPDTKAEDIEGIKAILEKNPEFSFNLLENESLKKARGESQKKLDEAKAAGTTGPALTTLENDLATIDKVIAGDLSTPEAQAKQKEIETGTVADRVKKMSGDKFKDLSAGALKNKTIALTANQYQMDSLVKESQVKAEALRKSYETIVADSRTAISSASLRVIATVIEQTKTDLNEARENGDSAEIKRLRDNLKIVEQDAKTAKTTASVADQAAFDDLTTATDKLAMLNQKIGS